MLDTWKGGGSSFWLDHVWNELHLPKLSYDIPHIVFYQDFLLCGQYVWPCRSLHHMSQASAIKKIQLTKNLEENAVVFFLRFKMATGGHLEFDLKTKIW